MVKVIDQLAALRARLDEVEKELGAIRSAQGLGEDGAPGVTGMLLKETRRRRELEQQLTEAERVAALSELIPGAIADPVWTGGLLDSLPMAVVIADPTRQILVANEHLRRLWGDPRPYRTYGDWLDIEGWRVEDGQPLRPEDWPLARAFATGETQEPTEVRVRRPDGSLGVAVMSAAPVRDATGRITFGVSVAQDITDQREAEERSHLQHQLLRHIGDSTPDVIFAKDLEGRMLYANRAALAAVGRRWEEIEGRSDDEWVVDRGAARSFMAADARVIASGGTELFEEALPGPDGPGTVLIAKSPLRDPLGRVLGIVGVGKDVTELKQAEERSAMLAQELSHRAKNTLAVVLSIARHSLTAAGAPAAARHTFEQRIMAMARAHDVLTRREWNAAELSELAAEAMSPYAARGDRVVLDGPAALLSPRTALGLSIALHELGTNASKYGALSREEGEVSLTWRFDSDGRRLHLVWEERGGPEVCMPSAFGFGSRMVRRALAHERDAQVEIVYPPSGVRCDLRFRAEAAAQA